MTIVSFTFSPALLAIYGAGSVAPLLDPAYGLARHNARLRNVIAGMAHSCKS